MKYMLGSLSIKGLCAVLLSACLLPVGTGCQKLFLEQDALLKKQPVTFSVKVKETVPPAAPPSMTPFTPPPAAPISPPATALDARLMPRKEAAAAATPPSAPLTRQEQQVPRAKVTSAETVLDGRTVSEDLTLRGTVLVRGSLVVAPQATLRLEAGTQVRFAHAAASGEKPALVVLGRIVALGTAQKPVVLEAAFEQPAVGDWAGVVLISTEKKNSLDHCRIEGAQTGLTTRYSQFSGTGLAIRHSQVGIALYDSVASLTKAEIQRCDVGLNLSDSEMEMKESLVKENRIGLVALRSALVAGGVKIRNNSQEGMALDQARFRISGSVVTENRSGVRATGGEGQILFSSFASNREDGVALQETRIRISDSSFIRNGRAGLALENVRGSAVGSVFADNGQVQVLHGGVEPFSALLNWWGSADERRIVSGIQDAGRISGQGKVQYVPFLVQPPANVP